MSLYLEICIELLPQRSHPQGPNVNLAQSLWRTNPTQPGSSFRGVIQAALTRATFVPGHEY